MVKLVPVQAARELTIRIIFCWLWTRTLPAENWLVSETSRRNADMRSTKLNYAEMLRRHGPFQWQSLATLRNRPDARENRTSGTRITYIIFFLKERNNVPYATGDLSPFWPCQSWPSAQCSWCVSGARADRMVTRFKHIILAHFSLWANGEREDIEWQIRCILARGNPGPNTIQFRWVAN